MYVKIHEQIFSSSIMEEDVETRYIWFCLLTLADKEGFIDITIPAIARRINLSEGEVTRAIDKFLLPDYSSRTPKDDGKRLEKIRDTFGWKIINYIYYRDLRSEESRREYMRNYMRERRNVKRIVNAKVNCKQGKPLLAPTAAATSTATTTIKTIVDFEKIWIQYPNKDGKKDALKHFNASVKTEEDYKNIQIAVANY